MVALGGLKQLRATERRAEHAPPCLAHAASTALPALGDRVGLLQDGTGSGRAECGPLWPLLQDWVLPPAPQQRGGSRATPCLVFSLQRWSS